MSEYGLLIDYQWCTGCHSCEVACQEEHTNMTPEKRGIRVFTDGPFQYGDDEWNWNRIPVPSNLCDLCENRVSAGKEPTCVHHCLAQVMKFGPIDELARDLAKKPQQVLWAPR